MLISTTTQIHLQKSYAKVTHVFPALNQTFALLTRRSTGIDVLVHCQKSGKILFQQVFQDQVGSLALPSDCQAIVLLTRRNIIRIIDLCSHKKSDHAFYFLFQQYDQSDILTFNVSQMFCVTEHGLYNDHRLKLTYYAYPFTSESKPIAVYESRDNEWTCEYKMGKGSQQSLVLWWKPRQSNQVQVRGFRVNEGQKCEGERKVFSANFNREGEELKIQCVIDRCWQMREDRLILMGINNVPESIKQGQAFKAPMVLQSHRKQLRESRLALPRQLCLFQTEQISFGTVGALRSFRFNNGQSLPAPVFFFNNLTEQVIMDDLTWECDHRLKQFHSGYERDTIIECLYQNGDVHELVITLRHFPNARMLALHCLLQICEDLDDDLLKEAVEYLPLYGLTK